MGGGGYIPRFRNLDTREKKFIRGYAYDFGSGGTPSAKYIPAVRRSAVERTGGLSEHRRSSMTTMGDVLPRFEHHVRIDPDVKDEWGIPSLHITQRYTDNEYEMAKDSMHVAEELCHGAGFEVLAKHYEMVPPGESIHELGTCRMGADPKNIRAEQIQPGHDVKNLFVHGRQLVRLRRLAKSDADHSGARHARLGVSGRTRCKRATCRFL